MLYFVQILSEATVKTIDCKHLQNVFLLCCATDWESEKECKNNENLLEITSKFAKFKVARGQNRKNKIDLKKTR